MTTMDLTAYDAVVKEYYSPDKIAEQSYADNPFFTMVPRQMAGGRRYVQPIEFGNPGGSSANFINAMMNGTVSQFKDFLITRQKQYQRILVDHETLLASSKPDEAFQPAFKEFDRGFRSLGEKISRRLFRTSNGSVGAIDATTNTATAVMVLNDKADVFNFSLNQICTFADTTGVTPRAGTLTVSSLDREGGKVTFGANLNTIVGLVTTDLVYQQGDFGACLAGLEDWLPVSNRATRLAASFFGVTRSADVDRLGGIFLDGTTLGGIDEILIKLVAKVAKHGGKPSHIFMNPETFADLQLLWNSKNFVFQNFMGRVADGEGNTINIGFPGMLVNIAGYQVRIYADRSCPSARIYCLTMSTWTLWYAGDLPGFLGEKFTGKIMKLAENEDSMEARLGAYCNLGNSAPGWNGVAQIPVQ